ncbi:hypothetical protein SPRG_19571 [Saprolegnia parasitica CBS 223.65]|uniref:Uncharacterized protein n=1 Tax=Saprolegnia parasitica (strain CBS 223.65) TaxID=695850 RepID=A0A067CKI1_SAPPC|nr:hypothetical protein SPRG_19571 [Saprolegnia parasitica CBS 223.65]KDO31043.1 hypothetical protein SPRG_19571 [Saprolegnia parasitica CBS 223.65]|eukprot:XP_012198304.1 hypothetical protein SPRG_19571 [Saprolegnia parasitica CBS 223.65]
MDDYRRAVVVPAVTAAVTASIAGALAAAAVAMQCDHDDEIEWIMDEKAKADAERTQATRVCQRALAAADLDSAQVSSVHSALDNATKAIDDLRAELSTPASHKRALDRVLEERDALLERTRELQAALDEKTHKVDLMKHQFECSVAMVRMAIGGALPDDATANRPAKRLRPTTSAVGPVPSSRGSQP